MYFYYFFSKGLLGLYEAHPMEVDFMKFLWGAKSQSFWFHINKMCIPLEFLIQ